MAIGWNWPELRCSLCSAEARAGALACGLVPLSLAIAELRKSHWQPCRPALNGCVQPNNAA